MAIFLGENKSQIPGIWELGSQKNSIPKPHLTRPPIRHDPYFTFSLTISFSITFSQKIPKGKSRKIPNTGNWDFFEWDPEIPKKPKQFPVWNSSDFLTRKIPKMQSKKDQIFWTKISKNTTNKCSAEFQEQKITVFSGFFGITDFSGFVFFILWLFYIFFYFRDFLRFLKISGIFRDWDPRLFGRKSHGI